MIAFSPLEIRKKMPPKSSPPLQQIVDVISEDTGCMVSTRNSRTTGTREKEAAPRMEAVAKGAALAQV